MSQKRHCFRVEVFDSDPAEGQKANGCVHDQTRLQARDVAQASLARGMWVEVFAQDSGELIAGPFSPDAPLPAFIL